MNLTPEKAPNSPKIEISSTSTTQRNTAIVLGSLAEKLAGKNPTAPKLKVSFQRKGKF